MNNVENKELFHSYSFLRISFRIMLFALSLNLYAADFNTVPVDSSVYHLLDELRLKDINFPGAAVKPYTEAYITSVLQDAMLRVDVLTPNEIAIVKQYYEDYASLDISLLQDAAILSDTVDTGMYNQIGLQGDSQFTVNLNDFSDQDIRSSVSFYMKGGFSGLFSYKMSAGLRYDILDSDAWLLPETFYWPNEGFYLSFAGTDDGSNVLYTNGVGIGFNTAPEVTLSLWDSRFLLRWGMFERDWGYGDGSLVLSQTAKPFDALEGHLQFSDWLSYYFLTGTLTDWQSPKRDAFSNDHNFQNMFTTKRVELKPFSSVTLALFETCVWIKRFELGYINPFMITTLYQNILGDWDNMFAGGEFEWLSPFNSRLYGSFVIDEMNSTNPLYWFKQVRNIFALQAGLEIDIPFIDFSKITAQYTRIEPFFYTHYPKTYPIYGDVLMNTCYQNKDVNLGYYLEPNSDEFLLNYKTKPFKNFYGEVKFRYIRHSSQYGDSIENSIIYDVIDDPEEYNHTYSEKNFSGTLTNTRFLGEIYLEKDIEKTPIQIFCNYGFSISRNREVLTWFDANETYEKIEANTFSSWSDWLFDHTVTIGVTAFY